MLLSTLTHGERKRREVLYQTHIFPYSFQSLLDEPNPNSPANNVAAQLYRDNRREYEKTVKAVVEESWIYLGD